MTKHLWLAPRGNSEFCFLATSMFRTHCWSALKSILYFTFEVWCLVKRRANRHGVERGTAQGELEGILQYGSYVLPQFSEFSTSRAHKGKWDVGTSKKAVHIYFNKVVGLKCFNFSPQTEHRQNVLLPKSPQTWLIQLCKRFWMGL